MGHTLVHWDRPAWLFRLEAACRGVDGFDADGVLRVEVEADRR